MWVFPGGRVDPGDTDPDAPDDELAAARHAASREAMEEAGLVLDPSHFVPFAHWVPPPTSPRRFATWFFAVPANGREVTVDGGEIHEHAWLRPAEALERHLAGVIQLAPPTWVTLRELAGFDSTATALEVARSRVPERYSTRPLQLGGMSVLTWHGDIAYESGIDGPGPRHRLWMTDEGWRFERFG
jgi:8-oxo-dGTP pyrophosphatase MutT (NUDIX family)